jgi:hypothetical protein
MSGASDALPRDIAEKLAWLLDREEGGWRTAAQRLDSRAINDGVDLFASYDGPLAWAWSVVQSLAFHVDFSDRFPHGVPAVENYEMVEDLFWKLMPHYSRD